MKISRTRKVLVFLWTLVSVLMISHPGYSQEKKISGTVISADDNLPVPGVSVKIKNKAIGVTTDVNGNYSITASAGDVLVFTSIGLKTQEIRIGNSNVIDVSLATDVTSLSEVVVNVGYGVQKKKLTTGANFQVRGEDIQEQSTTNALQALQGQTPGAVITTTSGQPGSGINVVIRGRGTISNPNPLYVIDGLVGADINNINPADIESIDVLKDAASAAIYGAQAANGVILVTTRTGKAGQRPTITFDTYTGTQEVARKAQLLNARELATIYNEALVNSGKAPHFSNDSLAKLGTGTNWLDQMFTDAGTQNHVLGIQGASAGSVYSASLSYTDQAGIVGGRDHSNYKRYGFKINTEHKLYQDKVVVGQHLNFIARQNNGIQVGNLYSNTLRGAFNVSPFLPMYDAQGNYFNPNDYAANKVWTNAEANPYASMVYNSNNLSNNQNVFGDLYASVQPIKGLTFRTSLGLNFNASDYRSFRPEYELSLYDFVPVGQSRISQSMFKGRTLQFDNLLTYKFNLTTSHNFDAMLGSSVIAYRGTNISGENTDARFSDFEHAYLNNTKNTTDVTRAEGNPSENKQLSYFGRLQYNFKETYLFNATFRADASSRFAPENRWGYYPSVSAGWIVTNEPFLVNNKVLDYFKLRASYGQVGNQNISDNQYNAPIGFNNTQYIFGNGEGNEFNVPGAAPTRLGNRNVKWETSEQINFGFDSRLFNKVDLNFDYYVKNTKDWLIVPEVLATAGAGAPFTNGGDVKNSGVELAVAYNNRAGDFTYSIGVNGSYNKNTIGNIATTSRIISGPGVVYDNSGEYYRAQNGMPVGYFIGYKTNGIFQTPEEINAHRSSAGKVIQPSAAPGDVRFMDLNDDGLIGDADRTMIGDPNPDYTLGINLSAGFKGFDFSVLASGVMGNQIFQAWRQPGSSTANWSAAILNRWHGAGTSNTMPRVTEDGRNWSKISDLYVHDGDFLRINNVTLGYDLSRLIKKSYLSKVRLYASALNLYTFTKYNGMDPELGYGDSNNDLGQQFSSGVDFGYYPRPRTFLLGANVKF